MKPLSIEQLKALEFGDWVWVVSNEHEETRKYYAKKCKNPEGLNERIFISFYTTGSWVHFIGHYGKTWVAYKNKEQEELQK